MHLQNLFKKNKLLFSYGFVEGIAKGLNVLSILSLAIFASINTYAQLAIFIICELMLVELILFGQHNVALRFINIDKENVKNVITSCTQITSIVFILVFLVSSFIPSDLFIKVFQFDLKSNFLLLIIGSFLTALVNLNLYRLRKEDKFESYFNLRLIYQTTKFLFVVILIYFYDNSVIYPVSLILSSACAIIYSTIKFDVFSYINHIFKSNYQFKHLNFGLPLMLHALSGVLYSQIDKLLLNSLIGSKELAIYHFNLTLGTLSFFIINVSALYFTPKIYNSDSYNDLSKKYLNNFLKISIIGSILFSLVIIFVFYPSISFFISNEYYQGKNILYLSCFYIIISAFSNYAVYKATAMKKVNIIPFITFSSLIMAIILNSTLIPIFSFYGAIISLICCEIFLSISLLTWLKKYE